MNKSEISAKLSAPERHCAILVPSCDPYADLWPAFTSLFATYWPDCTLRRILASNERTHHLPDWNWLGAPRDIDWSGRLLHYLEAIEEPYVLLMLEDFFLASVVDSAMVERALDLATTENAWCVRLTTRGNRGNGLKDRSDFREVCPGIAYRVSAQAAIWRRDVLSSLLRKGESIWQFEFEGTVRALERRTGCFRPVSDILPYSWFGVHHVVEKGKWFPFQLRRYQKAGLVSANQTRPVMSLRECLIYLAREGVARLMDCLPVSIYWKIREGLRLLCAPLLRDRSGSILRMRDLGKNKAPAVAATGQDFPK